MISRKGSWIFIGFIAAIALSWAIFKLAHLPLQRTYPSITQAANSKADYDYEKRTSGICIKCLASESKVVYSIDGKVVEEGSLTKPGVQRIGKVRFGRPEQISNYSISYYEEIFGQPCVHEMHGLGFSSSRWMMFNGQRAQLESDGFSGDGMFYYGRTQAIERLFALYQRLGDRELAKETYAIIDSMFPSGEPQRWKNQYEKDQWVFYDSIANTSPTLRTKLVAEFQEAEQIRKREQSKPLELLTQAMVIAENIEEWREINKHNQANGKLEAPFFKNLTFLSKRFYASNKDSIRIACFKAITLLETEDRWAVIELALEDPLKEIRQVAANAISRQYHFPLFGKLLRKNRQNLPTRFTVYSDLDRLSLTIGHIKQLLTIDDKDTVAYALYKVDDEKREALLSGYLDNLNNELAPQEEVAKTKRAILSIIKGPPLWERDPEASWANIEILDLGISDLRSIIESQRIETSRQLKAAKSISTFKHKEDWSLIEERWLSQSRNWYEAAIFIRAMHELDPTATEKYLIEKSVPHSHQRHFALAAMGLIASA